MYPSPTHNEMCPTLPLAPNIHLPIAQRALVVALATALLFLVFQILNIALAIVNLHLNATLVKSFTLVLFMSGLLGGILELQDHPDWNAEYNWDLFGEKVDEETKEKEVAKELEQTNKEDDGAEKGIEKDTKISGLDAMKDDWEGGFWHREDDHDDGFDVAVEAEELKKEEAMMGVEEGNISM